MGSFNVAATASGLSIGCNDEALLFPLIPSSFQYKKKISQGVMIPHTANLISNEGACIFYEPFCLPIKGKYNDYGGIEDIVEDDNTRHLEEFFGLNIQTIADSITGDSAECEDPEKNIILASLAGMWENKTFYDNITKKYSKPRTAFKNSDLNLSTLKTIGFVENSDKNTNDQRYNIYLEHPNIKDFIGYSDGTWVNFYYKGELLNSVYSVKCLCAILRSLNIPTGLLNNLDKLRNTSVCLFLIEKTIEKINKSRSEMKPEEDIEGILEELKSSMVSQGKSEEEIIKMLSLLKRTPTFNPFENTIMKHYPYLQYAVTEELKFELEKSICFQSILHSTNKIFMPCQNGEQEGNDKLHKLFTEETLKVLNYKLGIGNF